MDKSSSALFGLLRSSLGCGGCAGEDIGALTYAEWNRLVDIAFEGGVAALAVDGLQKLYESNPELELAIDNEALEDLKYEWFGSTLQTEDDYRAKFSQALRFASALAEKGVRCRVLKGMAFAQYYPVPEHRECGDCDVYLGSGWSVGNEVAVSIGGRYEFGTYKHSHLFLGDLMIENHRYLTDFNGTKQGKKIELLLERAIEGSAGIGSDTGSEGAPSDGGFIGDSALVRPNDYFNALFLIRHAHGNFMYGGLTLRMIYDWAALLKCCGRRLEWKRLYADLDECRLKEFAKLMISLCVEYLGTEVCPGMELCEDKALVEEVMEDTIAGGIHTKGVETFWKKCIRIARRFARIWHYRHLATESVSRMIWNNFAFSSYMKRKIEM